MVVMPLTSYDPTETAWVCISLSSDYEANTREFIKWRKKKLAYEKTGAAQKVIDTAGDKMEDYMTVMENIAGLMKKADCPDDMFPYLKE